MAGAVADVSGMDSLRPEDVRRHANYIQAAPMVLLDANLPDICLQVTFLALMTRLNANLASVGLQMTALCQVGLLSVRISSLHACR